MSLIQKKVIEIYRNYPELLVETEDHSLRAKRLHLHDKFLLFMEKIDFKVNYDNKQYKEIMEMFQMIHLFDIELVVKMGVQYSLWGETVYRLGTKKHSSFIHKTEKLDIFGCFAMTEVGHGSNIMKLETTATYDHENRSFIINSPLHSSHKYWIGQASMFAHYAVVFAQLIIDDKSKGVHPFIVPLRGEITNEIRKNITIQDCGIKNGLNSIDNGKIIFNKVVIPYDFLLDKFAYIDTSGNYIKTKGRLSKMLNELSKNRMGLGLGANLVSRYALKQTLMYTKNRKQFGSSIQEYSVIEYSTTQHRLFPLLASTYINMLFNNYSKNMLIDNDIIHFNSIICKVLGSWNSLNVLQQCRECCGGHGYHYNSYFGKKYRNLDIYTTFEGDNTVLLQQLVQTMLKKYKNNISTMEVIKYKINKYLHYLQSMFPNFIVNSDYKLDIVQFKYYIDNRIKYKLYSLLLYFNDNKDRMDSFVMWKSKLSVINNLANLISFQQLLEVSLESVNEVNLPLIEIFILDHIKKHGVSYLIDNSISASLIRNLNELLEIKYQKIMSNMNKYINLLDIPNIDSILNNNLHKIRSVL